MQNRYVADIGDFGKYALLRFVAKSQLTLGVNWYLTPDENHNLDGKHTAYLQKDNYKGYDDDLFSILRDIIDNNARNVSSVQNSNILPKNTIFYNSILDLKGETDHNKRKMIRHTWHTTALERLNNGQIIFLDPDNGLQVNSVSLTGQKGNKYIGISELKDYYMLGKSIIFYNHRERKQEEQYLDKFRNLQIEPVFKGAEWIGMKYVRGTIRDYIFILQPEHFVLVKKQCDELLQTVWKNDFSFLNFSLEL